MPKEPGLEININDEPEQTPSNLQLNPPSGSDLKKLLIPKGVSTPSSELKLTTSTLEPLIEHKSNIVKVATISPGKIVWGIFINGAVLALGYAYSGLLPLGAGFANEFSTDSAAATGIWIPTFDAFVVFSLSPVFVLGFLAKLKKKELDGTETKLIEVNKNISGMVKNTFLLTLPPTIISIALMSFSTPILKSLGQNPEVLALNETPFRISAGMMLSYDIRFIIEKLLLAENQQNFISGTGLFNFVIAAALMCVLSLDIDFGAFSGLNLGITGIALSMLYENLATLTFYLFYMLKNYNYFKNFFTYDQETRAQFKFLAKVSLPLAFTLLSEWFTTLARNLIAVKCGVNKQPALNTTQLSNYIFFLIATAISEATALKISGEKQHHLQVAYALYGLLTNLLIAVPLGILFGSYPTLFTRAAGISSNSEVTNIVNEIMPYVASIGVLNTVTINMRNSLIAKTQTWPAVPYNLVIWIGVGLSFVLSQYTDQDMYGLAVEGPFIASILDLLILSLPYIAAFKSPQIEEIKEDKPPTPKIAFAEKKPETPRVAVQSSSKPVEEDEEKPRLSSFWGRCFGDCFNRVIRRCCPTSSQQIQTSPHR